MSWFIPLIKANASAKTKFICVALYILSLFLEGIIETRGTWSGALVLAIGWIGPLGGIYAWYANPLLILSLITARNNESLSRTFALVGLVVGATAVMVKQIPYDDGYGTVLHLGVGYYIWLICFPLAFAVSIVKREK